MPSRNGRRANDRWISIAASTAARGASNAAKNSSARASTSMTAELGDRGAQRCPHPFDERGELSSELPHQRGGALDVGHQHRHEPARQLVARTPPPLTGIDLAGDETDRHDAVALCSPQQPRARTVTRRVVFELDLAEPGQRVADVRRVVDREPPVALRIDVGERSIRERSPVGRREPRHAATVTVRRSPRPATAVHRTAQPLLRCATRKPPLPNWIVRLPIWIVPLRFVPVREVSVADDGSGWLRSASTTC